mmetsp:Transcript_30722/g.70298  ORF Transcript_30722/g.70298 Transcript_30722/m.70298 type:complete len:109 (+) Transcript_30722:389-715(+)
MSLEDLQALVDNIEKKINDADEEFQDGLSKLQDKYEAMDSANEAKISEIKKVSNFNLLKSIRKMKAPEGMNLSDDDDDIDMDDDDMDEADMDDDDLPPDEDDMTGDEL